MTRFNRPGFRPGVHTGHGPARTTGERTVTYEGAPGYVRDAQTDLVFLALTNMVGQDTFYESAADRDDRFRTLVRTVATGQPIWLTGFIPWLRNEANMRSAALVAAAETAKTLLERGVPGARRVIDSALQRADEPGEFLGYWISAYGKRLPMAVKRGVGDAAIRLYTERSLLKYDTASHGLRFGDVLELTHPGDVKGAAQHLKGPWQGQLFKHAIDRRHGRDTAVPESLTMLLENQSLRSWVPGQPEILLQPDTLRRTGMTWEDALSLGGQYGLDKRELWEAMIPSMGYMALLRNLRNFDEAGISQASVDYVTRKLMDPDEVARSRQLPFRFYSAYKELASLRWGQVLEVALNYSALSVPEVRGRSLVLVDLSGSMRAPVSGRSKLARQEAGALFGAILAARGQDVTLVGYGTSYARVDVSRGASVLRLTEKIQQANVGGWGTETYNALVNTYAGHDQVFIFTDEQSWGTSRSGIYSTHRGDVTRAVPASVPLFAFNLAGYGPSSLDLSQPNRHAIGGFTDKLFTLVERILAGSEARWPWEE
jgi:TROVE domain